MSGSALERTRQLEDALKEGTQEDLELVLEKVVAACPNLFVVARGLRAALRDDWEKAEMAELLMEGIEE